MPTTTVTTTVTDDDGNTTTTTVTTCEPPSDGKTKLRLQYFDFPGRAEPARLAFTLGGIEFEDDRFPREKWTEIKPTTPFGQVPVLYRDGKPIAQSMNILRIAGREAGLYPDSVIEDIDETIELVSDLDRAWSTVLYVSLKPNTVGYSDDFPKTEEGKAKVKELRTNFVENVLPQHLQRFVDKLNTTGAFLCGDSPTIADCAFVPGIRRFQAGFIDHVPPSCLDKFPVILAYLERFAQLPAIKTYSKY